MSFTLESLAALATILGTILSVVALVESRKWLVLASFSLLAIAIGAGLYARRERHALRSAAITVEGRSIDALNVANLRRRVNRTLLVQEAHHTARIDGEDIEFEWTYSGFCRAKSESAMEFSVESEQQVPFDRLDCLAYDLQRDPKKLHPIRPLLIGADGVSKKISVPFLRPVRSKEAFGLMLRCTLPRATKAGFGYYSSTLSFEQDRVAVCIVRLIFVGSPPEWVRVYDCSTGTKPVLVKALSAAKSGGGQHEYIDEIVGARGQSARVYTFWREIIGA